MWVTPMSCWLGADVTSDNLLLWWLKCNWCNFISDAVWCCVHWSSILQVLFFSLSFVFVFSSVQNFYHKQYDIHPRMKISSTSKNLNIEFSLQTTWVKWEILFHLSNILCCQFCLSMPTLFLSHLERSVCQSISPSNVGSVHRYVFVIFFFLWALLVCLPASLPISDAVCQYVFFYLGFVCLSVKCLARCTLSLNQCVNVHCCQTIKGPIFRSSTYL